MYDEENKAFTSSLTRIVQLIESAWSPILNRHQDEPPDWLRFQEKILRPGEMPSIGKFFENGRLPQTVFLVAVTSTSKHSVQKMTPQQALMDGDLRSCAPFH